MVLISLIKMPLRSFGTYLITSRYIELAHRLGKKVHAFVVNDPKEIEMCLEMGIDGIITDRTDLMWEAMTARGLRPADLPINRTGLLLFDPVRSGEFDQECLEWACKSKSVIIKKKKVSLHAYFSSFWSQVTFWLIQHLSAVSIALVLILLSCCIHKCSYKRKKTEFLKKMSN